MSTTDEPRFKPPITEDLCSMQAKSEFIRQFIVNEIEEHPKDIARLTAEHFSITRQAVNRHLKTLIEDEIIQAKGKTKERVYSLKVIEDLFEFALAENRDEDKVWRDSIGPLLTQYKEPVQRICYYGFTEMFNNAIDHSDGTCVLVAMDRSAKSIGMDLVDDGVGIFEKIKSRFGLADHREAILELIKGKLTTDPSRHTGQGIFFTSRMFDDFAIKSGELFFNHKGEVDWLIEVDASPRSGTTIRMVIAADTQRTSVEVFNKYSHLDENDEYPFSKTHVPLSLARYGHEQLVSRSQAKRVLARFERFEEVFLDFHGIEMIGQAFADEIFRVYRSNHPEIELIAINANQDVTRMIRRAESPSSLPSSPNDR